MHPRTYSSLWGAAVKSMKTHLWRVIGETKLNFEEFATVLTQIEACLNSRPLGPLPCEGDTIEPLTPGHFLVGRPLEALPDPSTSYRSVSLLKRWYLCQHLVRHFWKRWTTEYIDIIRRFVKCHNPSWNLQTGDVVILHESNLIPTKWLLGRIVNIYPGKDRIVRVVDVKTTNGTYKRPITKIALLLPIEHWTLISHVYLLNSHHLSFSLLRPFGLGRRYVVVSSHIRTTHFKISVVT